MRLLDLPIAEQQSTVQAILAELGAPAYRGGQLLRALWQRHVRSFSDMVELPADLRRRLDERIRLGLLDEVHKSRSADGTTKYLWKVADGGEVESVAIPSQRRLTFCVSSQVGCTLACRFCATGYLGFQRNLSSGEICDQVLAMLADLGRDRALNVVFMGMGEPGHNLEAVLAACRALNDAEGAAIGARHITVSTAGVVPAIRAMANVDLQLRLAVSLHSADQHKRLQLMNIAERHDLVELASVCAEYQHATGRHVTLEYTVLPGINDGPKDALDLANWASGFGSKVNIIPFNPVPEFSVRASSDAEAGAFAELLRSSFRGEVVVRRTRGRDIEAACGMLHRARAAARSTAP